MLKKIITRIKIYMLAYKGEELIGIAYGFVSGNEVILDGRGKA